MIEDSHIYEGQFGFQANYARGKVCNVGCNTDGAYLGQRRGAVNLDYQREDTVTDERVKLPINVQADARYLPLADGLFDSVVLGEILEHCEKFAAIPILNEVKRVLKSNGRSVLVVTWPHDIRGAVDTTGEIVTGRMYAPSGIYGYHYRLILREEMFEWFREVGFEPILVARLVYPWGVHHETKQFGCEGTGVVAAVC